MAAVKRSVRHLLGYPHPRHIPRDGVVELAIGISTDEVHLTIDFGVTYLQPTFPLLEMDWSTADCLTYLNTHTRPEAAAAKPSATTFRRAEGVR